MLRDVVELRDNKWVQKQRLAAQMPVKDKKQKKGGPGKVYIVLIICLVFLSSASLNIEHSYWFVSSR